MYQAWLPVVLKVGSQQIRHCQNSGSPLSLFSAVRCLRQPSPFGEIGSSGSGIPQGCPRQPQCHDRGNARHHCGNVN
jgi:hypothetical protein